jgi:hypothetical protein
MHDQLIRPFSIKSASDVGTFEGLLSVYGNVDLGGDIVLPGAIQKVETTADGSIRILDGHDTRSPVGKGKLTDGPDGLRIKGTLDLGVARARELLSLMKQGIVSGLSIGFNILPDGMEMRADGVRLLKKLHLFEASLTCFPMNPEAAITSVKRLPASIAELETGLRNIGFSKRKARGVALHAWPILRGPEPEVDLKELTELFDSLSPKR